MKSAKTILTEARALIANPANWTQRQYARDATGNPVPATSPQAVCFCALGAVGRIIEVDPKSVSAAESWTMPGWRELHDLGTVIFVNDNMPHDHVLALFDQAIGRASELTA